MTTPSVNDVTPDEFHADCAATINSLPHDTDGYGPRNPAVFVNENKEVAGVYFLPNYGCIRSCTTAVEFADRTPGRTASDQTSWRQIKDELGRLNDQLLDEGGETFASVIFGKNARIQLSVFEVPVSSSSSNGNVCPGLEGLPSSVFNQTVDVASS